MKINKILIPIFICLCLIAYTIGYSTTTTTTNLSLVKPAAEDTSVDYFDTMNDNLDLIDAIFDTVTLIEYSYLDGVTSAIQTQLNAKQPLDAQLTDIAGLTPTDSYFIVGDGVNFVTESGATARTSLGLTIGTHVQAYDAGLLSIAGLTTAANKSIYTTALDTYATYNLTAFARTILDDANEATVKATLNLEIGTDVQAYDAALTSISGLTYVSPSFIKLTANDTYAVRTIAEVVTDLALNSDNLSDVASIAMLDEWEETTKPWTFDPGLRVRRVVDAANFYPYIDLRRVRDGDPTDDVADGDYLGAIIYSGYHTNAYYDGAIIRAIIDGTSGEDDMPGRLEFLTSPDGTGDSVLRMAIDNAGNIKMGDGSWTNYVNVTAGGVLTFGGTATINEPLSILAATTSAELAGVISDETGTLKLVYSDSPVFTTNISTPNVVFPATQVPSADANTLDDYEEGTWTVVIRGSGTAGTYEIASQDSSYTKIGRVVFLESRISMAASVTGGGDGYLQITGCPFTKKASSIPAGSVFVQGIDYTGTYLIIAFIGSSATDILYITEMVDNGNAINLPIAAISADDLIYFSITFFE